MTEWTKFTDKLPVLHSFLATDGDSIHVVFGYGINYLTGSGYKGKQSLGMSSTSFFGHHNYEFAKKEKWFVPTHWMQLPEYPKKGMEIGG